jgi:outer membrane receptor protein involved in Fe transport
VLLKGSVELARRLPGTAELFGDGLLIQPAPALEPERSLNYTIGFQYDQPRTSGRLLQVESNVFLMQLRDMIRLAQGFAGLAGYTNLGRARIAGFDVEAKADLTRWLYGSANLTYQDARDVLRTQAGSTVPNPTYKLRLPHMPWLFGGVSLEAHTTGLLREQQESRIFYEGSYTEEYFYAFELSRLQERRIPRAITHTIGVEQQWRRRGLTFSAELQNITDASVLNQFNQPLPGRSFRSKIRYTWVGKSVTTTSERGNR